MGANEDTLKQIADSPQFEIPELVPLRVALDSLQMRLKAVAENPGWEGTSAEAASEAMLNMRKNYFQIEQQVKRLEDTIDHANQIRTQAIESVGDLPDATAPSWVHTMLDAADPFDFPGIGPVSQAQGGLALIENFLGNQREEKAKAALETYQTKLETPSSVAADVRQELRAARSDITWEEVPVETPTSSSPPIGTPLGGGNGNGNGNGTYTPGGTDGGPRNPDHGGTIIVDKHPPKRPPEIPIPTVPTPVSPPAPNVDDGGTGQLPGGSQTGGGSGSGGLTGGLIGGASGSGSLGAGLGGGLGAAGALAAARMGSGGAMPAFTTGGSAGGSGGFVSAGSAGAAPRLGSGGLLGGSGSGGTGSGSASSVNAGGAGSRGGMGAGGMGGQGNEKKKRRAGVGLGGPMAPKLDDDEQVAPRAAGTQAGARGERLVDDATTDSDDAGGFDETGE